MYMYMYVYHAYIYLIPQIIIYSNKPMLRYCTDKMSIQNQYLPTGAEFDPWI